MSKIKGDLYWGQLSMWESSHKNNIDTFNDGGFHYELMIVKEVINDNHTKVRNVNVNELTPDEVNKLKPEPNHNWHRVMGNNLDLIK